MSLHFGDRRGQITAISQKLLGNTLESRNVNHVFRVGFGCKLAVLVKGAVSRGLKRGHTAKYAAGRSVGALKEANSRIYFHRNRAVKRGNEKSDPTELDAGAVADLNLFDIRGILGRPVCKIPSSADGVGILGLAYVSLAGRADNSRGGGGNDNELFLLTVIIYVRASQIVKLGRECGGHSRRPLSLRAYLNVALSRVDVRIARSGVARIGVGYTRGNGLALAGKHRHRQHDQKNGQA